MEENLLKEIGNLGAMAILGLIIYRMPAIISAFNAGVQLIISNVTSIQDKALTVFKEEATKDREVLAGKFEVLTDKLANLETGLTKAIELATTILNKQDKIESRVENLEKAVNK